MLLGIPNQNSLIESCHLVGGIEIKLLNQNTKLKDHIDCTILVIKTCNLLK